jgi:hypothetical protein
MAKTDRIGPIPLRMTPEMNAALRASAAKANRSMHGEMVARLIHSLDTVEELKLIGVPKVVTTVTGDSNG